MRELRLNFLVLALAVIVVAPQSGRAAGDFKTGEVVDKDTASKADGLLPPEILKHYQNGEYVNKFVDWPMSKFNHPPDFKAASDANAGKFTVSPEGTILDKTGKQPAYIMGFPFPTIDDKDPQAAVKILWNHFYRTWYFGSLLAESQVNWISTTSLERRADVHVTFGYYDGVPQEEIPGANPDNFLYRNLNLVVGPADLNGTAALTWRYRDPTKRDSTWAYVPALRRVRATSPANRSDGFLGSDESQDDGPFFDGKVEDFDWKLIGQQDQLRLTEELNMKGEAKGKWTERFGGAWDTEWPDVPFIGYMDKDWKGVAWAPTANATLSKRRFWVIEGVPRDKYYLYGKIQLYVDKETFQGAWNRKFSWTGELLNTLQTMGYNLKQMTRPDGTIDYIQGSNMSYNVAENIKANRATVAGLKSDPKAALDTHHPYDPAFFDMNSLSRFGK